MAVAITKEGQIPARMEQGVWEITFNKDVQVNRLVSYKKGQLIVVNSDVKKILDGKTKFKGTYKAKEFTELDFLKLVKEIKEVQ